MKPRKPIRRISPKRAAEQAQYRKVRKEFLAVKAYCEVCKEVATEVHHHAGRIGRLLCDTKNFHALCFRCHRMAHDNIAWARAMGLICESGGWNSTPKNN